MILATRALCRAAAEQASRTVILVAIFFCCSLALSSALQQISGPEARAAQQAIQRGDYAHAEKIYRALLKRNPSSPELLSDLGIALHFQGKTSEAVAAFQHALRLKEMPATLAMLSLDDCKLHRYRDADAILLRTKRYFDDSKILAVVAPCYLNTGDLVEGIGVYRELVKRGISPADQYEVGLSKVYLRAAQHYITLLQQAPGGREYSEVIPIKPESKIAEALRDAPYVEEGMSLEELASLQRRHQRHAALLYLLAIKCGNESMRVFSQAEQQFPNSPAVRERRAQMLEWRGQYGEAIAIYEELLRESPSRPDLHANLATCYQRTMKWQEALGEFQKALALAPRDEKVMRGMSECLLRLGRTQDLKQLLLPLAEAKSPPKWVLLDLASAEEEAGHSDAAIEYLQRVAMSDPGNKMACYRLHQLFRRTGRNDFEKTRAAHSCGQK